MDSICIPADVRSSLSQSHPLLLVGIRPDYNYCILRHYGVLHSAYYWLLTTTTDAKCVKIEMNFQPHSAVLDDKTECECVFYQPRPSSIEGIRDIIFSLNPSHFTPVFVSKEDLGPMPGVVKMISERTGLTKWDLNICFWSPQNWLAGWLVS